MAINWIVASITLLMFAVVIVWSSSPKLRVWFEAPKYRVLEWDRVAGNEEKESGSSSA